MSPEGHAWLLLLNPLLLMATSPIFGAFGPLSKSIGSVTYSTLATARDGKRKQVARQKPSSVRNPNTVAQILQRMKLVPAQRFYDAFEKVVAKGIMSHSWEGVSYGNASRQEFMSRAMKNPAAVYVPKGYNAFAPGEFEVSAGSLPEWLGWRKDLKTAEGEFQILDAVSGVSANHLVNFQNLGYQAGDQITIIGAMYEAASGAHKPFAIRCVMNVGNLPQTFGEIPAELYLYDNGVAYEGNVSAFAVIISRGLASDAKRTSATMLLTDAFKSLISPEAMNTAIASYQENVTYNSLGSDWFLNQGTIGVNGQVKLLSVNAVKNDTETTMSGDWAVVEAVQNGQVGYYVLDKDSLDSNPFALGSVGGSKTIGPKVWSGEDAERVTAEEVARGIVVAGLNSFGTMRITQSIAEQGGFTVEGGF